MFHLPQENPFPHRLLSEHIYVQYDETAEQIQFTLVRNCKTKSNQHHLQCNKNSSYPGLLYTAVIKLSILVQENKFIFMCSQGSFQET